MDHLAPSDLTIGHLEDIRDHDRIRSLQIQRHALHGTLQKAKHADSDRYREHEAVVRELTRVRAAYRREKKVEFRGDYFNTMPGMEIDKQIDQLLGRARTFIRTQPRNGILQHRNTPLLNEHGPLTLFSALMPSHSREKWLLLDKFKLSLIWQRFVSYASRAVAESRSTGTRWRRLWTPLSRTPTSKTLSQ